jgi:hypothetical protein
MMAGFRTTMSARMAAAERKVSASQATETPTRILDAMPLGLPH